jgi:hypothetical protein
MPAEMLDHIMSADRFQQIHRFAEEWWSPWRNHGQSHLNAFVGRFYGANDPVGQPMRPLNRVAQTVRSYLPKLVPTKLMHYIEPKRYGLELEAKVLKRLIETDDEKQDIIFNVYEPMIAEAWFYPLSVSYTACAKGQRVLDVPGNDISPSEPYTLHIPFELWCTDPFAEGWRTRQWECHRYRIPRLWMLQSEAFQHLDEETILAIPAAEDAQEFRQYRDRIGAAGGPIGGAFNAWLETVELINVVFYDRSGIYEATITPLGRGPGMWLRAVKLEDAQDGGPYDHLWYQGVPGMLVPAALLGFTRDISEASDALANKNIQSALLSKKMLGYASGAEDEAKALIEKPHATMINMEDPRNAQVFDLNLVNRDLVAMQQYLGEQYDEAAGSPKTLQGGDSADETATGADIRNSRASEQIAFMAGKVNRVMSRGTRKRLAIFQTDPNADHVVSAEGGDGSTIELAYGVDTREGAPDDFAYTTEIAAATGISPEIVMARVNDAMERVGANLPLFQMGIFNLQKYMRLMSRRGAEGLDDIVGDPQLIMERMAVDGMAAQYEQAAKGSVGGGQMGQTAAPGPQGPQNMQDARASARSPAMSKGPPQ